MRVLVIEDQFEIAVALKAAFEGECFAVDVAHDGQVGYNLARTYAYDLLVLDNMLPNKTGLEICTDIRLAGSHVPIIFLSALSDVQQKILLLNAGADDYMIKPYSSEELLARSRALLRRPLSMVSRVITLGGIELHVGTQTVKKSGVPLNLTKKEFMLLECLMRNHGVVLTRGMLMEQVWEMHFDLFSNTIEAHITSLRKKLGSTGKKSVIRTISGRGYVFVTDSIE